LRIGGDPWALAPRRCFRRQSHWQASDMFLLSPSSLLLSPSLCYPSCSNAVLFAFGHHDHIPSYTIYIVHTSRNDPTFKVYTILSSLHFAVQTISLYRNIAYHSYVKYVVLLMPFTLLPLCFLSFLLCSLWRRVFLPSSFYSRLTRASAPRAPVLHLHSPRPADLLTRSF